MLTASLNNQLALALYNIQDYFHLSNSYIYLLSIGSDTDLLWFCRFLLLIQNTLQ